MLKCNNNASELSAFVPGSGCNGNLCQSKLVSLFRLICMGRLIPFPCDGGAFAGLPMILIYCKLLLCMCCLVFKSPGDVFVRQTFEQDGMQTGNTGNFPQSACKL